MSILGNPITLGGGGLELVANVADGATVTATLGSKTVTGVSSGGQARLKIPQEGKWTVSAVKGLMVSVPQDVNVPATLDIPLVAQELNDTSWAAIKQVSDANMGANFWSVGDCKQITMNGYVSDGLTLTNYSTYVFIVGFNHNVEREGIGITFQGFKKSLANGKDIALNDSGYSADGGKRSGNWFNMNNSQTSSGGWERCHMRSSIMNSLKASLPSDLQSVIKEATIYTNNVGNMNTSNTPTATADEMYLPSEYEIFGKITYSLDAEANFCKQFSYYAAGNSKRKYRSSSENSSAYWWLRSPAKLRVSTFCWVNSDGSASRGASANNVSLAHTPYAVAPCFKV